MNLNILFLIFIIFNSCFNSGHSINDQLEKGLKEFEIDLLYKKHIQDEIDRKEGLAKNKTNLELISLDKEKNTSLNSLFENKTILIDDSKTDSTTKSNATKQNEFINLTQFSNSTLDNSSLDNSLLDNSTLDNASLDNSTLDNSTLDNSTLDHEEDSLFEIDDDQLLVDGFQSIDKEKSFLLEEFVTKLSKQQKLNANLRLICLPDNCEQRILLITIDRIVLKYELIRQNLFLDKSAKYYDYLNCFYIQYNPNFGLRSFLRNGFTFDFKKAFIDNCLEGDNLIYGSIYLTNEFKIYLKQQKIANILTIKYDREANEYYLNLGKESKSSNSTQNIQAINSLNGVYKTYLDDQQLKDANSSCEDDYLNAFNKILSMKKEEDKISYLNQLNSSLFNYGLHQKLNKFKYLKAQILFDSGLLTVVDKENHKILNHLFQIIYETQNYFKQLNFYLVITRFRFKLPNELELFSGTNLRKNVTKLYDQLASSNQDTYFDLPADFKIVFLSFKFYYQNSSRFLPSYSNGLISHSVSSSPILILDFSYLQINHWLLAYEIAHLFGINDDNINCKCTSGHCLMRRASGDEAINNNEFTWSDCTFKQLNLNLKLFKFNFNLPIERSEFKHDFFNQSICGNGVLERNEQCDCGKFGCFIFNQENQTYLQNRCCNSTNCKLNDESYQCAIGSCCDLSNCTFYDQKQVCRSSQDICDIEEKCDGATAFCPVDDFYVNGEFCALNR